MKKIIKKIIKMNILHQSLFKEMEVIKNKTDKSKEIRKRKQQEQKNLDHLIWAEKIQVKWAHIKIKMTIKNRLQLNDN
jgi:hypothetical protein